MQVPRSICRLLLVTAALVAAATARGDEVPDVVQPARRRPAIVTPATNSSVDATPAESADDEGPDSVERADAVEEADDAQAPLEILNPAGPFLDESTDGTADRWTGRVGAIFLHRFGSIGNALHPESNFAFPLTAGVDVALRRQAIDGDLDFRYFNMGTSTAVWDRASEPDSPSISSTLQSAELNLRSQIAPATTFLAGFRYLRFADSYDNFRWSPSLMEGLSSLQTVNNLYGFQLGGEHVWNHGDRFRLTATFKGLLFGDSISGHESTNDFWFGPQQFSGSGSAVTLGLDLAVAANLRFTEHWSAQVGYQFLMLSNVALAAYQNGFVNSAGNLIPNSGGTVFFEGLSITAQRGW